MALSKGRREQLEQAKKNAKIKAKQKQNKALIQQYNATHKNAPKQTISAKGGSRNTRQSTGTTRSTAGKTRMNGSLGNSFGGSKTGGVKTTTDRRANAAHKADAERRQSTTLRQGSSYLTGGSTRKATPYAAAQQVYTPLRSNDRRARAGRAADANRTINARNQMAANTQMNGSLGNSFGGKLPTAARNTQETTTTEDRRARIGRKADEEKKQRQTAIDTLNANSVRWHNTTDETEKNRLHAVNNRIRSMYGMTYEGKTGRTYLPTAGQNVNVSHPVELYSGAEQPQTEFNTQEDKDKRYKEIQSEIDRMKKAYTGLSNFHFGMSENNKADKDAKKQLIKTLEDERNAVTGGTTRKVQAAKSIGNQIVGSPAALAETAQQQSANVEESRKNPEYVRLEQLQEQLELTLAGLPSTDADGKPPAEYMNVYNQLQYVKEQKDKLAVKTTVDPNKWGQQKLTKAAEQKANATTGMTEGKKFAADTAIGVAGNAPQMAASFIPVVGPAIGATWSGVNAAGQRSYELNQQGVAPNESLGRGIVSGVIEAATEKSPMESLANIATKGGKGLVSNIAKQALSEAGEESLGYAANYAADVAANDPNAHFSLSELGQNALGGAAGGAMFGGIGTGIHALRKGVNYLSTARNGNNAAQNQTAPIDTQVQTQYTNNNGGVANGINGQQNGNGDFSAGLQGRPDGTAFDSAVPNRGSNDGRANSGLSDGVLLTSKKTRQIMDERGLPNLGLKESTGDNTSFSYALDAAQVDETQTIPRLAVDDAGNPNGGLSDAEMQWAKLLVDNSLKTGIPAHTYVDELVTPTMQAVNETIADVQQYIADYIAIKDAQRTHEKGKNLMHHENGTTERLSLNEPWYSEWYKRLGNRKPAKKHYSMIAENIVSNELKKGGGDWVSHELAQDWAEAQHIQAAYDAIGDDAVSAEITPEGLKVIMNGTPAHTANIQDTNARLDRNIISPVMQGATAAPINLTPKQRAGQTQSAPTLADVRQARNDIMPKLTRAGAETAQTGVQTAPPEITQPMQENAQAAAQQADINPKLTKAEVNAESSVGAAETGFDPYSKMVNDYGAIEPGMNPSRVVDVPQSTNGTDRVSNVARTIMESGVTPDNLIPALENHIAEGLFSHDVKSLKKTLSGATKTIQKKGWQGAFDQWEEVTDGRRAVTDDDIALGQMMYTAAVEAGDTQTAMKLAGDLAVQGTALGRGVNAFKLLKKTTPEGQLYYLQKSVQKIQQEYQSRFDKQAGKAAKKQGVPAEDIADQYGLKLNEDLVQEFLNAETDEARTEVVDRIYDDVAQQIPKTLGDRFNAWRYFSMLGNPRTHIRNTMGNVASAIALDASHKVSAAGQKLFLPQEKRTRTLHTSKAAKQFAKADYANVEAELSGNAYKTEMSEIKQRQKLFPKPLQKVMDANTRALDAEDQVFKKKSYIDSMGNFLTARGWDVNNLTEAQLNEARQHAIQDAKIATFQDASKLADKLSEIEHSGKAWGVIIGSLFPFKRTPINVAKRSFELSPVGLLKAFTYDAVQVKKGNMDATKMIDHIGQSLTGSGIAVLGAFLAAQGIFSAGSSDDDKEANFDAGMGQQEYAINIGGKSYTIDWASPVVVPLAMGGELYNALQQKYDDEETAFNQAMATVSRMFDPLLNMTMLSGIGSTISSAAYNKSNPLFGIASNVATNFGGQFVPTLFGQIARTVDNTRRTTYADKNSPVPSSVQKFLQRQANKIPGLSQYQPAYTDVWGREQKNGPDNVFARAAYNFFSPGYLADAKGTQAEKALKELYQATGDNSVLPSKPQKYYKDADGVKKFLNADQYSKLTSEGGKISLDAIDKLTKSEAYKQMSNDERIEAVADIYKYAKDVAANKTYGKELDGTTKLVKESGMEPGLYYAYKEMQSNFKASMENYEAFDQTFLAIKNDKSLSEQEKNSLYHNLLIKGNDEATWKKYTEISDKVTAEEFVDALTQVKYIKGIGKEELSDETGAEQAKAEATEFSKYLDMMGYTGEKRAALEDKFGFYSMIRQDPQNYTFDMLKNEGNTYERDAISAVESSGMSASQYNQIKTLANRLQAGVDYEKGKSGAKKAAQAKIVSQNVNNYDQYAAVMSALGLKRFDSLYSSGGKLPEDSGLNTGINVNRSSASQKTSSAGFVNPTTASNSVVTSGYGGRNAPKTSGGYGSSNHDGIDIGGTGGNLNGQAADSIGGGKVAEVGYDENGYGNYVVVDHGNGYTSLYGHLQKATVKQGETVSAGQQVGVIGSTGNSSGPHLHLRVRKNGQSIDPRTVIPGYK